MKTIGNKGFALVEALMLVFIILVFLTSLFSAAGFRNRKELIRIKKLETSYAASAALDLMISEIIKEGTSSLERGMEQTEISLVFEPDDGSDKEIFPLIIWTEREGHELYLYVSVTIGNVSETASAVLYLNEKTLLATDSGTEMSTCSNAGIGTWVVMEKYGV